MEPTLSEATRDQLMGEVARRFPRAMIFVGLAPLEGEAAKGASPDNFTSAVYVGGCPFATQALSQKMVEYCDERVDRYDVFELQYARQVREHAVALRVFDELDPDGDQDPDLEDDDP